MISDFEISLAILLAILLPIVFGYLIIQFKDFLKLLNRIYKMKIYRIKNNKKQINSNLN